jgi:Xaa-Pro dipeptidase
MSPRKALCEILSLSMFLSLFLVATAKSAPTDLEMTSLQTQEEVDIREWNNQIRREKFDIVLPLAMRKNNVDMWIHVMRIAIPDDFGAEELGSTSGVFVFTDRGVDRIERAVLGRRWGATHRGGDEEDYKLVENCGAYDIIDKPVFVKEPLASPMTEYDFRFKGLREFVEARNPKRIAVNFKLNLGPWETYVDFGGARDGLSHTDYLLLARELGDKYASRLVSSEYVLMDYIINKVPSEIKLLKKISMDRVERVKKTFAEIEPGVTKRRDARLTVFRRTRTGESQRGRTSGFGSDRIERGDIVASPSQGLYGYVLREDETEPPPEIKKLWAEYLKIDKILAETIKAGLTPREIKKNYMRRFEEEGIIVREDQLHMFTPKNNFPIYSAGFDPENTQLSVDCHGMMKGARERPEENYHGPRISSYGPTWTWDIPLPPNHHFVLEYFFYMPSPTTNEDEDQYLFWWDHEQALATENGVEYLTPPQKELYLIK